MKKSKTILVTGGAGFIGSNFIRHVLAGNSNFRVINFDKLTYAGNRDNLIDFKKDERYIFVKGDITNMRELSKAFSTYKPTIVINFAAETHVDRSIHDDAGVFVETNVFGVFNLLELVRDNLFVKKFVQMSTDEVYGDLQLASKRKFLESDVLKPSSPYAGTKASADMLCHSYYRTWGVPVTILRCGNNYGPYQYPEKLIPFFTLNMISGKKLPLYGNGKHIRDWVHVADTARAIKLSMSKGESGEIYNISSGHTLSNLDVALKIAKFFGEGNSAIKKVADRPGHDMKYSSDASKIKQRMNWRPREDFSSSFEKTISWYMENTKWLDRLERRGINSHI